MNVTEEMVRECWDKVAEVHGKCRWRDRNVSNTEAMMAFSAELASRLLQPTPGPPDLYEKLRDAIDAWVENGTADHKNGYQMCVRFRDLVEELLSPPEPELPKCRYCNSEMIVFSAENEVIDEGWVCMCGNCWDTRNKSAMAFIGNTKEQAIAACRKAGE